MRICPVNLSFGSIDGWNRAKSPRKTMPVSWYGQVYDKKGNVYINSYTKYCRSDIKWDVFKYYLKDKYKNYDKVNTYLWACSSGNEALTMAVLLKDIDREEQKFFPIYAKDVNGILIDRNQKIQNSGVRIDKLLVEQILENTGINLDRKEEFFKKEDGVGLYSFKNDLVKNINYETSNILVDIDKIDRSTPSIVMCRNMWPYVDSDLYDEFTKNLYDVLPSDSIVVIGEIDNIPWNLTNSGFKAVNPWYIGASLIFEKQ